jgi:hypothetical protein
MSKNGAVAVVRVADGRLELMRHPDDGGVIAFEDAEAAFCFAVSLAIAGELSAATIGAPVGIPLHVLEPGASAADLLGREIEWEAAA